MNRIITLLVVLAVVAVAVVATLGGAGQDSTAADESSSDDSASRDLIGPHSPEGGALPGELVVARGEKCVIQRIELDRMRFSKAGPESGCDFLVSPDGSTAAVVARGQAPDDPTPLLELVELGDRPEVVRPIGRIGRSRAWSPDASHLAACSAAHSSETVVINMADVSRESWFGCWPAFSAEGALVTRDAVDLTRAAALDGIYSDGEESITLRQLFEAARSEPAAQGFVLGHTTSPTGVVVSLVNASGQSDPLGSLQFWQAGTATNAIEIPLFLEERGVPGELTPESLRDRLVVSPSGHEVAMVLEDGAGLLVVVDVDSGDTLGPLEQHGFDWSPDGRWLAVATDAGVDVYGPLRDEEPTFQIPLVTPALAWQ